MDYQLKRDSRSKINMAKMRISYNRERSVFQVKKNIKNATLIGSRFEFKGLKDKKSIFIYTPNDVSKYDKWATNNQNVDSRMRSVF